MLETLLFSGSFCVRQDCGLHYKSSYTILRVEKNEVEKKNGIASLIRFTGMAAGIFDLPDISDITPEELLDAKELVDIKKGKRRRLKDYMKRGCIWDFKALKRLNRRGRHFYGTIIEKGEDIWGVLLMDSEAIKNPIVAKNKERFDSFAKTVGGIINIEVE